MSTCVIVLIVVGAVVLLLAVLAIPAFQRIQQLAQEQNSRSLHTFLLLRSERFLRLDLLRKGTCC
jgi:predicted PurR-regulated permease PerM